MVFLSGISWISINKLKKKSADEISLILKNNEANA